MNCNFFEKCSRQFYNVKVRVLLRDWLICEITRTAREFQRNSKEERKRQFITWNLKTKENFYTFYREIRQFEADIRLFLSLTDAGENAFGKGRHVATLDSPTREPVQTIILRKNIKARFVTLALSNKRLELQFREVEIYNGPLLGNNRASLVAIDLCFKTYLFHCPRNSFLKITHCSTPKI